jgi:ribosomal protein S18 acetylase RimI-like enzyme
MTLPVDIRAPSAADLAALVPQLVRLPLLVRYGHSEAKLAASLQAAKERGDGLLIAAAPEPIGLAWFQSSGTLGLGGYLRLIAIAEAGQTKGIGKLLLEAFEQRTFAASAHAFLLVSDFNHVAQRFYERHGYQQVGALPGLVLPGVQELIYWKRRPAP